MIQNIAETLTDLFTRGGWVMWPLLGLSIVSLALILERFWFWMKTHRAANLAQLDAMMRALRHRDAHAAQAVARAGSGIYHRIVLRMLDEPGNEAAAVAAVESQRPSLERYMPTLSTVITAAPMLGILGTVTGIIQSFRLLSHEAATTDPRLVSQGIAEALLTTAAGLIVALIVLFPYNAFKAQIERSLSRIEALMAAAQGGHESRTNLDVAVREPDRR